MGIELFYSGAQWAHVMSSVSICPWFHRLKPAALVIGCLVLQKCLGTMQKATLNHCLINTQ